MRARGSDELQLVQQAFVRTPAAPPSHRETSPRTGSRLPNQLECGCGYEGRYRELLGSGKIVPRDNQGERRATIRMRMAPGAG